MPVLKNVATRPSATERSEPALSSENKSALSSECVLTQVNRREGSLFKRPPESFQPEVPRESHSRLSSNQTPPRCGQTQSESPLGVWAPAPARTQGDKNILVSPGSGRGIASKTRPKWGALSEWATDPHLVRIIPVAAFVISRMTVIQFVTYTLVRFTSSNRQCRC